MKIKPLLLLILLLGSLFVFTLSPLQQVQATSITWGNTATGSPILLVGGSGYTHVFGPYIAPYNATVSELTFYGATQTGANIDVTGVIYSNVGGNASALLATSSTVSFTSSSDSWYTVTGLSLSVTIGVSYWFGLLAVGDNLWLNNASDTSYYHYYQAGATAPTTYTGTAQGGGIYSIYATIDTTDTNTATAISANSTNIGTNATFSAYWAGVGSPTQYILGTNLTGTPVNETVVAASSLWSNITKSLGSNASLVGSTLQWQIYMNNSAGNWATTGLQNLTLTISPTGYILKGPYYEDNGAVVNSNVSVTTFYTNGESQTDVLNGTLGYAQLVVLNPLLTPSYISWQAIANYSYTRLYYFGSTTSAIVNIMVPNPASSPQTYQFTITDFYGMTDPYISSAIVVDGNLSQQQYIIERKPLTVGTVSLIMEQWHSYSLVFDCDQGTYTQTFSAENSFLTNINILSGAFPAATTNGTAVSVTRTNSTTISTSYSDGDSLTQWIYINITHAVGSVTLVDYTQNTTGTAASLVWANADASTDYTVTIYADVNGTIYEWIYQAPAPASSNPFTGVFDFLGTWEINGQTIDPTQIIAAVLILFALAIGSVYSLGFGCVFAWIIGGICIAMGWWQAGLPIFGLAGFTSVIIAIEESKRNVREV